MSTKFIVRETGKAFEVKQIAYYDEDDNLLFSNNPKALELYASLQNETDDYGVDGWFCDLLEELGPNTSIDFEKTEVEEVA